MSGRSLAAAALAAIACAAVVFAALPALGQGPQGPPVPCTRLDIGYNRWVPLEAPDGMTFDHIAAFAQAPCTFIATAGTTVLRATGDGWSTLDTLPEGISIVGVVAEEAPAGTAFVLAEPAAGSVASGLYVTRDFGRTLEAVDDFSGFGVTTLAVAPGDPQVMYAGATTPAAPIGAFSTTLFKSTDFGNSWLPLPATAGLAATELAVDATNTEVVWANNDLAPSGTPAGLWLSDNGGATFRPVYDGDIADLDTAAAEGAGRVDAATSAGVVRSRDQGTTFVVEQSGLNIAAIAHETFLPHVIVAVVDGIPSRSIDMGRTFMPVILGLPSLRGCSDFALTRNDEHTSYFFLSVAGCEGAGHYVYRSDGFDVLGEDYFNDDQSPLLVGRRPRLEMPVLAEVPIPYPMNGNSGSVAFDGKFLYVTDQQAANIIYSFSPEGVAYKTWTIPSDLRVRALTYDSTHHRLWLMISHGSGFFGELGEVYTLDLKNGSLEFRFDSPIDNTVTLSWDADLKALRGYQHHGYEIYVISKDGELLDQCTVPGSFADPNVSTNPDRGHPENPAPGFASGIAAGKGNMYLQLEDDRTLFYVSPGCEILQVMEHRRFEESAGAGGENDQLACDTITFGRTAIWIRDAGSQTMVAYAVPGGYCPIGAALRFVEPTMTAEPGGIAQMCAFLHVAGRPGREPIAGAGVRFFRAERPIGDATTGPDGVACTSYAPPGAGVEHDLDAVFYGNSAYRPSSASGVLAVLPRPFVRPRGLPLPPAIPPPPVFLETVVPNPPVRPQAPQPQSQPQPQQQLQGQAALAAQEQEQPQLAFQNASRQFERQIGEQYAMSSYRSGESDLRSLMLAAGLMAVVFASLSLAREQIRVARIKR